MTDETAPATEPSAAEIAAAETSEQRQVRLDKRAKLLESGIEAYPAGLPVTTTIPAATRIFASRCGVDRRARNSLSCSARISRRRP